MTPVCRSSSTVSWGAFCNAGVVEDGGTDPCSQDGLVCDISPNGFCRNPNLFDPCVQGGPACNGSLTTTSAIVCSDPIFGLVGGDSLCVNVCETTEDCVDPWQSCLESQGYADCAYATSATGCAQNTPSDLLQTCDSASTNDGICLALGMESPSNSFGLCTQAFTDGDGGTGQSCNAGGNRQLGGLCDTTDLCLGNTCGQLCNASMSAAASCGAGTTCVPLLAVYGIGIGPDPTNDAYTTGACATPCDFTLQDAGSCGVAGSGVNAAGVPVKCLPAEIYGYTAKEVPDFCMVGPTPDEAIALGADCTKASFGNDLDPCVAGAICIGNAANGSTCLQLCEDKQIGKTGAAGGCAAGDTGTALNFLGGATGSTHTGYCMPPAAG